MSVVARGARAARTCGLPACHGEPLGLQARTSDRSIHQSIDRPTFDVRHAVQVLRLATGMASRRPVEVCRKMGRQIFAATESSWGLGPRAVRRAAAGCMRNVGLVVALLLFAPVNLRPHGNPKIAAVQSVGGRGSTMMQTSSGV